MMSAETRLAIGKITFLLHIGATGLCVFVFVSVSHNTLKFSETEKKFLLITYKYRTQILVTF